jgi:hypothetical protein
LASACTSDVREHVSPALGEVGAFEFEVVELAGVVEVMVEGVEVVKLVVVVAVVVAVVVVVVLVVVVVVVVVVAIVVAMMAVLEPPGDDGFLSLKLPLLFLPFRPFLLPLFGVGERELGGEEGGIAGEDGVELG